MFSDPLYFPVCFLTSLDLVRNIFPVCGLGRGIRNNPQIVLAGGRQMLMPQERFDVADGAAIRHFQYLL